MRGYTRKDGTYVAPYDRSAPGTATPLTPAAVRRTGRIILLRAAPRTRQSSATSMGVTFVRPCAATRGVSAPRHAETAISTASISNHPCFHIQCSHCGRAIVILLFPARLVIIKPRKSRDGGIRLFPPSKVFASQRLVDFDAADERVIDHRRERNHVLATRICCLRELLDVGDVLPTRRCHDVKVRQHLRPIDAHVEYPRARGREECLAEVQTHCVA